MSITRRQALAATLAFSAPAFAQTAASSFPSRPVTLVVGLGPGAPDAVPAAALAALAPPARVFAPPLPDGLLAVLAPVVPEPLGDPSALPPGAVVVAPDAVSVQTLKQPAALRASLCGSTLWSVVETLA